MKERVVESGSLMKVERKGLEMREEEEVAAKELSIS